MKTFFLILLCTWPAVMQCQVQIDTAFYDQDMKPTIDKNADVICVVTHLRPQMDRSAKCVFVNRKGEKLYEINYSDYLNEVQHGPYIKYHSNGKVATQIDYYYGQQHGNRTTYYRNGRLKRKDQMNMDSLLDGAVYSKFGKKIPYFPYEEPAIYPGGLERFRSDLVTYYRYPKKMVRKKVQGTTILYCYVDARGKIKDIQIHNSAGNPALDNAAIKALKKCKKWKPATLDGEPCNYYLAVPVVAQL